MLNVSESAIITLKNYLRQYSPAPPVRISVMPGSCAGPSLRICVDEKKENDYIVECDGLHFVVDKELLATCGTINVDFLETHGHSCSCSGGCGGFQISGEKSFLFNERCHHTNECDTICRCGSMDGLDQGEGGCGCKSTP